MELLEVRCCCQPQKLLGWLPYPRGFPPPHAGQYVTFLVWSTEARGFPFDEAAPTFDRLTLPIEHYCEGGPFSSQHLAFKSEETPLEELRRIRGFVEAHALDSVARH